MICLESKGFSNSMLQSVFLFETNRTSTMRVIHIAVKTDETQRLRIKFVFENRKR